MEEWKDIDGYEGYYQVSNMGRIRSLDRNVYSSGKNIQVKGRILKNGKRKVRRSSDPTCYENVVLSKNGETRSFDVHRLVANAFVQNSDDKPEVNHIDGDKSNNLASNLEWTTHRENIMHAVHKLHKREFYGFGIIGHRIKCIETGEIFSSKREACRAKRIDRKDLYMHLLGKKDSVKGLHWEKIVIN